jgi:putative transposase
MPRHQRILSKTGIYHVMTRGNERKNLFLDEEDKQRFLETLFIKKEETGFFLYAYCLMGNHIHLLIRKGGESLATTMKRINASYAYYFNQRHQRVGHLFQDRFKSEPVETEQYLLAAVRYIHNNPVKAGMVERAEEYQWSSFGCYISPDKLESKNVDAAFILSMISTNRQEAIREFRRLSLEFDQNENEFLDVTDKDKWTIEEGKLFLEEYLKNNWPGKSLEELIMDTAKRNEIVAYMRGETGLSIRKIATLLSINRGSIQNVKPK